MWNELLTELAQHHRFKIIGTLIGLLFALLVIRFGLLWTLFISLCAGVGYWIGKRLDDEPAGISEIIERLLPPGDGRR